MSYVVGAVIVLVGLNVGSAVLVYFGHPYWGAAVFLLFILWTAACSLFWATLQGPQ